MSINSQSINQSINQSVSESITTEITQNRTLGNVIWVKEHVINKIPIIMSVCKFKIMRSRVKTLTMISMISSWTVKQEPVVLVAVVVVVVVVV